MPDIPGMTEAGLPEYAIAFWYGLFVPAGTPSDVVGKLFDAALVASRQPAVKAALAREGTEIAVSNSPEEFAAFLAQDEKLWVRLAKESGAKADCTGLMWKMSPRPPEK
jgi:tripartite-type tricarboxylate transporter receptor subunit TctC